MAGGSEQKERKRGAVIVLSSDSDSDEAVLEERLQTRVQPVFDFSDSSSDERALNAILGKTAALKKASAAAAKRPAHKLKRTPEKRKRAVSRVLESTSSSSSEEGEDAGSDDSFSLLFSDRACSGKQRRAASPRMNRRQRSPRKRSHGASGSRAKDTAREKEARVLAASVGMEEMEDDIDEFPSPRRPLLKRRLTSNGKRSPLTRRVAPDTKAAVSQSPDHPAEPAVISLVEESDESPSSVSAGTKRPPSSQPSESAALKRQKTDPAARLSTSQSSVRKSISDFFPKSSQDEHAPDGLLPLSPALPEVKRAVSMFSLKVSSSESQPSVSVATPRRPEGGELWIEKYAPKSVSDLAVRKDKLGTVRDWISRAMTGLAKGIAGTKRMLIITGPCGAGKTAMIKVLANELGAELCEWTDPCQYIWKDADENIMVPYESRMKKFRQFMIRSERLGSLSTENHAASPLKRLILLEQLPYAHDSTQRNAFNDVMKEFLATSSFPLVFILSDENFGKTSVNKVFTHEVVTSPYVHMIHVNPVVTSTMARVLKSIIMKESLAVPAEMLERIVENSCGDLRGAINALQFYSLKDYRPTEEGSEDEYDSSKRKTKKGAKKKKAKKKAKALRSAGKGASSKFGSMIGSRDMSYNLFRALGKICYNKRLETSSTLIPHSSQRYRKDLAFNPEKVLSLVHISDEVFTAFLHENYLRFFRDIDDATSAAEYISDADVLAAGLGFQAMSSPTIGSYVSSIASRGLLYSNRQPVERKFQPMYKPFLIKNTNDRQDNASVLTTLFVTHSMPPPNVQLYNSFITSPTTRNTEVLPFASRIAPTIPNAFTDGQRSCMQLFCRFSSRQANARLDQNDTDKFEEEFSGSTGAPVSQVNRNLCLKHRMALGSRAEQKEEDTGSLLSFVGGRFNEVLEVDDIQEF